VLSQTSEYALRAVLYLADRATDQPSSVDDIAEALGAPRNYLSKILHRLAQDGVLVSARGKGGGFRLGCDPDRLTLADVLAPFDPDTGERRCLLGRPQCSDRNPCPAHHQWKSVSERVSAFFRERTVGELIRGAARGT
jgi:Rrf2 family iron-sulfur cluster assembly transcriptional regulator